MTQLAKGTLARTTKEFSNQPAESDCIVVLSDANGLVLLFRNGFISDLDHESAAIVLESLGTIDGAISKKEFDESNFVQDLNLAYRNGEFKHLWGDPNQGVWQEKVEDGGNDIAEADARDLQSGDKDEGDETFASEH